MSGINDPDLVRKQYASEDNLRTRQALYDETTGPDPREVLWQAIVDAAPSHVLEVGGGPGELAERMRTELECRVSYIDLSPRMVELARARGVDAQIGDVQELPFEDGSFDTAVAAWMLYHVPDLDRGLAELARVLEPGGRLIANTNSVDHLRELRDLIAYPARVYEHMFSSENGEQILRSHFADVHRIDTDGSVTVCDREKLVAYQRSIGLPTSLVPDDVPLPFVVRRAGTVFVATK